ncbi:hypothetical protein EDC14_102942 [Hydrogenispora ethanolica]|jgi:muramoyltetrapeptide carboxypeptidase|uniref:LD-carboxypeptidase n=1 Tax=Hydrogenispora ethanolica TaxID=1082276 RepID=A0A4R1R8M4_HYDET|nr:hypothetical protein EDC14_102942 [Hydrogenispora ethanolica]
MKALKLQRGDRIGIVSPSNPITAELMPQFEKGMAYLKAM